MCGIFGVLCAGDERVDSEFARSLVVSLLRFSETRGREAAGLAVHNGKSIEVLKQAGSVTQFLRSPRFREILDRTLAGYETRRRGGGGFSLAITGHSRLVTNGTQSNDDNNQPVITHGTVLIHNGIVVNDRTLAARYPELDPQSEVDSEVLAALLRKKLDEKGDLVAAARETFAEIEGSASISMLFDHLECLLLATNTGSLFRLVNERGTVLAFASERFILQRLVDSEGFTARVGPCELRQIQAGTALAVSLSDLELHAFSLSVEAPAGALNGRLAPDGTHVAIIDHTPRAERLRRCKQCILPETYPFMDFDAQGICRYCRNWRKIVPKGVEALRQAVEPYRSKDGSPDVIVAFSGGRDSSYGLHYVKKVLGMNPVAFTYDWGMVTDLARRNQARVCGKLGVEHILRSADIVRKRRYVRKNVEAWLKKPDLGMVTLFTAGDKEFYAFARRLRQETGIKLVVFCTGNMIEDTPYKTGLCGIREDDHGMTLTGLSFRNELALLWYYARNYLRNPGYLNESLRDTLNAYYQTFVVKDDFLYLFHYLEWREEAVRRAKEYAKPRWPSIREYAQLVGFNCEEALQIINSAPKLY